MPGLHRFLKKKVLNQYSEYSSGIYQDSKYARVSQGSGQNAPLTYLIGC